MAGLLNLTAVDRSADSSGDARETGRIGMKLTAIRRTAATAGIATLLVAQLASAACGQAGASKPAARASNQPAAGYDWRLRERNELSAAAPGEGVTRISGRQQDWKLVERNELPGAAVSTTGRNRQKFLEMNELPALVVVPAGANWKLIEQNVLPSAVSSEAPTAQVAGRGRQKFLEMNELPGASAEVTPKKGPR
jgi:hypothetical protein